MLNLFWAHQGPLGRLHVFALNVNVARGESVKKQEGSISTQVQFHETLMQIGIVLH